MVFKRPVARGYHTEKFDSNRVALIGDLHESPQHQLAGLLTFSDKARDIDRTKRVLVELGCGVVQDIKQADVRAFRAIKMYYGLGQEQRRMKLREIAQKLDLGLNPVEPMSGGDVFELIEKGLETARTFTKQRVSPAVATLVLRRVNYSQKEASAPTKTRAPNLKDEKPVVSVPKVSAEEKRVAFERNLTSVISANPRYKDEDIREVRRIAMAAFDGCIDNSGKLSQILASVRIAAFPVHLGILVKRIIVGREVYTKPRKNAGSGKDEKIDFHCSDRRFLKGALGLSDLQITLLGQGDASVRKTAKASLEAIRGTVADVPDISQYFSLVEDLFGFGKKRAMPRVKVAAKHKIPSPQLIDRLNDAMCFVASAAKKDLTAEKD